MAGNWATATNIHVGMPSGMPIQCVNVLEGSARNEVFDLLPGAGQAFLAAGTVDRGSDTRGWVSSFAESGEQRWFTELTLPDQVDVKVVDLATDGSTGAWALLLSGSLDQLLHLDQAGQVISTVDLDTSAGVQVRAQAIEHTSAGVWIAGASQGDLWLALYDPATDGLTTLLLEDHLGFNDEIQAIGRSQTKIAVAATVSTSPNFDEDLLLTATTDILVIYFDLQGKELRRTLLGASPESAFARHASSISADLAGRWFVGGIEQPFDPITDAQLWLARVESDTSEGSWEWTSQGVLDTVDFAGIVGVNEGILAAAGRLATDASSVQSWLGSVTSEGALDWQRSEDEPDYDHATYRVLVGDAGGQVRGATKSWGPGDSSLLRSCLISQ